jgi:hypothetical protein
MNVIIIRKECCIITFNASMLRYFGICEGKKKIIIARESAPLLWHIKITNFNIQGLKKNKVYL